MSMPMGSLLRPGRADGSLLSASSRCYSIELMREGKGSRGGLRTLSPAELARTLAVRSGRTLPSEGVPTRGPAREADTRVDRPSGKYAKAQPPAEGRYSPLRELGRGGQGRVEELLDKALGRTIAKKTCLPDADEEYAAMLVAEAQI